RLAGLLPRGVSLAAAPGGRADRPTLPRPGAAQRLPLRQLPQPPPHGVRLAESVLGGVRGLLRADVLDGRLARLEDRLMVAEYQTHEHDVLVIGAGGAGLRAAIEASAAGVSVGLVCKSLLGKAHTVMA